uniref:Metalloendopeptidase n=1 Tax=Parastrongyloides trichosuri TaxID=131310 RepID=A0A0N5A146_PARTI
MNCILLLLLIIIFTFQDMKLNKNEKLSVEMRDKRSIYLKMPYKWEFPIKYSVKRPIRNKVVDKGIKFIEKQTCVRFKKVSNLKTAGLIFTKGDSCSSVVGKKSKIEPQQITITEECEIPGVIEHETAHALGLLHEHTRNDRDNYVKIYKKNIFKEYILDFHKFNNSLSKSFNISYDLGSVMQYQKNAGSKNEKSSVEPNNILYSKTMGQRTELSFNDIKLINYYYCGDICKNSILKCLYNGYPDPNNCNVCKCPRIYSGNSCQDIEKSDPSCKEKLLKAEIFTKHLNIFGKKSCYHKIYSDENYKVILMIKFASFRSNEICQPNYGLEVKFLTDKSISGVMFCGISKNIEIESEDNEIVLHYKGIRNFDYVKIKYKQILKKDNL